MHRFQFFSKENKSLLIVLAFLAWSAAMLLNSCDKRPNDHSSLRSADNRGIKNLLPNPDYMGSESCKSCHEQEYADWLGSDHDRAMMVADSVSVLANFDTVFVSQGVTSRFYSREGKYFVHTEGKDGIYNDFEIIYTFGIRPLQQYIVEFPRGKFQCLRTAWDTEKNVWFDLYPDMEVIHSEWIHWTKGGLNWNTMCSDCHSTYVKKNYDLAGDAYNTTFSIINVSCEACHGPGREHVELSSSEEFKNNPDSTKYVGKLYMGKYTLPKQMVDDCARCHSLRTQYTEFYDHEGTYMDHYAPDMLRDGQYFADGQILGEDYVYGSFIQSKMYAQNVKCNDCHNVHSLELKAKGNELCLQCHVPEKYDSKTHHFHLMETEAAECITCHMPGRYYMGNDFRRDHSFRVPRPDQSVKFDVPNTCNSAGCHDDKTAQWAAKAVKQWYGPDRAKHFSDALTMGRTREPEAVPELIALARDVTQPAIARSTALMYLGETVDQDAYQSIIALLDDTDPLVRYTSARTVAPLPPEEKAQILAPLLTDDVRSVRIAALSSMVGVPKNLLSPADQLSYDDVFKEYWKGLMVRSDFPGGQMELAQYYEKTGNPAFAEQAYLRAIDLDSYYNPARINLAGLYYGQGRYKDAEALFLKVVELEPAFGQAYYSLGLLYAEQKDMAQAEQFLKQAAEKIDYNDRVPYNYGLVLQTQGKYIEAEKAYKSGLKQEPNSVANLYALLYLYMEQKRFREAKPVVERLLVLEPQNQQYRQIEERIQQALAGN
ncbi:MAG: tetratricopeptide repeat protein [Cyclobacteriaceae bacterium]|nr:tetratricopeptide repeat protein [Cyclobacteriaceae bacterium]